MQKFKFLITVMAPLILAGNLLGSPRGSEYISIERPESCGYIIDCATACDYDGMKWYVDRKKYNLNVSDEEEATPLIIVARNSANQNCLKIAQMLVKYKDVNINAMDNQSRTALINALSHKSQRGEHLLEMVDALLYKNTNSVKHYDKDYRTALHYAIEIEDIAIIKKLITKGAEINATDKNGSTPLHTLVIAFENVPPSTKTAEIIDILYRNKANINYKDNKGNTPLHIACGNRPDEAHIGVLNSAAAFKLADLKPDLTIQNKESETAIDVCEKYNHPEIAEYLKAKKNRKI